MRLIDADVLKFAIQVDGYEHFSGCLSSSEVSLLEMVKDDIDETPTVDAVPVVRCRECIHYEMGVCLKIYDDGAVSRYAWQGRKPDDFCSYGKRKEGAD